ncbi:MAG: hypothetical protein ACD_5C00142G0001 [uncultured bacterium]|nr:MAG: hypothetical protein ACD_5C00142G0001 [uncultured bacterium]
MFEFGFKNKTEAPKAKIKKNIFHGFDRAKKFDDDEKDKEEKKVHFKFTGDGDAQRFVSSDLVEQLGSGIEESLMSQKKVDPEIQIHPHRERDVLKKMIATAYENIFNINIPEDKIDIKNEFEEARNKGGKFNRIRASFGTTMRNKRGFSNDEVEERMKEYYFKKMKELDLSEELKQEISNAWNVSELHEEAIDDYEAEENNEKSALEIKIKEVENFLEYLKERINSSTRDDLQSCSFYIAELGKINKEGLNEEGQDKMKEVIAEYKNQINKVWNNKAQELEYEGRFKYRSEMVRRALAGWKDEIKKIKPEEGDKLSNLEFYIKNVSLPKEDGLKGEYLDKLRLEAERARKEITHVWQEKKHELEVEKNKKEFENAIKKIHEISKEEYEKKYGAKNEGEHWLSYDLRNEIRDNLNFYLDHVVHPIDASPVPENWNKDWEQMQRLVETINSETQYELVIVDGETYSVQVQDQDFSHMSESYDDGFESEKGTDSEEQFSNIAGSFEGYKSDEDLKSEGGEKREDHQSGAFEESKYDSNYGDEIIEEENKQQVVDSEAALDGDRMTSGSENAETSEKKKTREETKEGGEKVEAETEAETEAEAEAEAEAESAESYEEKKDENAEDVFKKLPDGITGVFKQYASILVMKLGGEISDKKAIADFLISELTKQYNKKKEVMLNDFGFTEKDGKIFIEKIVDEVLK